MLVSDQQSIHYRVWAWQARNMAFQHQFQKLQKRIVA